MKFWVTILLLALSTSAVSDERILNFHSDIRILTDGMIDVTETIVVRSEGQQIRRGIYRDFPVEYEDNFGNRYEIALDVLAVRRNSMPESFHSVREQRDIRVYFGQADRLLSNGVHTYTFHYRANRMLGFFDAHDELYWNVTGNRWNFVIDKASATVTLDFDANRSEISMDAYTGRLGSKAQDYSGHMDDSGALQFSANHALPPAEGLTIVVGWPKGHVVEPTQFQRLKWLLSDNKNLLIAIGGLILLIAYYIPVWRREGKDPEPGVIVTRYQPPEGFSPASLRYIRQMYYDDKTMTAGIVNLAVKGYLQISDTAGTHTLRKLPSNSARPELAAGERELLAALFDTRDSVTLKQANHEVLGAAQAAHKKSLQDDYKRKYFRTNGALNIPAIVILLLTTLVALNTGNGATALVIATIIVMFLTMAFFAIIMKRPTMRGRKVLDEMLGFKDYLEVAEKEELNMRNPPQLTPQLFEQYLPFALALGVDQQWSEKFARLLASINSPEAKSYSPSWYDGRWNSSKLARTTSRLSSGLNSAISSSVRPPGSSSGGGGGGSSGGGGGGGGGGGW